MVSSSSVSAPDQQVFLELIAETLSRRLESESLQRVPRRLVGIEHSTRTLNCGDLVERIDKKYAKK